MDSVKILALGSDGEEITDFHLGASAVVSIVTKYNYVSKTWSMDIFDANGEAMVNGVLLVPGLDLLKPYPDVKELIGSFVAFERRQGDYSGAEALGSDLHVVWYAPGEEVVLQYD